jgi:hypothetical protein
MAAIIPTWRHAKPEPPTVIGPIGHIAKALRDRETARSALHNSERDLATVVAQQPPAYRRAFAAFRAAGGTSAEQWMGWVSATTEAQGALHFRRLELV